MPTEPTKYRAIIHIDFDVADNDAANAMLKAFVHVIEQFHRYDAFEITESIVTTVEDFDPDAKDPYGL